MELTESSIESRKSEAHKRVDDLARQASERAGPAIEQVAQAAHRTVDRAANAAAPAAEWARNSADQLKQQQDILVDSARGYIQERPLVVIGAALALGFLFGRLAR